MLQIYKIILKVPNILATSYYSAVQAIQRPVTSVLFFKIFPDKVQTD